jgi:hypothetical protein
VYDCSLKNPFRVEKRMIRLLVLLLLIALGGCREEGQIAPYLGPYYGGFDTAMTADPGDDLNTNECPPGEDRELCRSAHGNPLSHLLMKLGKNSSGELTIAFYRSEEDYEAGRAMYLSEGCRTTVGPAKDLKLHSIDDALDETQLLATANFPLEFGNNMLACTNSARLGAGNDPAMVVSLQVNPVSGASAISIKLEKSRRDGDYLYVKKDGEKVPVKLDLRYVGTDGGEARRLCTADDKTTIENKDGVEALCVMTGRKKWRVVLPLSPYGPGVTVFWGSTLTPTWYRTSDEPDIVSYHQALFVPVQFEDDEVALPAR